MALRKIKIMEVCGTHTMAIARAGIKKLLPDYVTLVSGPGCPVCVTAQESIDWIIEAARQNDVVVATFGDMIRVPGSSQNLDEIRREGGDVRVVYSCRDALTMAEDNPQKKIIFMGVGFETTSPTIAATILEAKARKVRNFFVAAHFKLIFPALKVLGSSKKLRIDGFLCPGHVSVITGSRPYEKIAALAKKPCVITGFDPPDIFRGIERLVRQIKKGEHRVEIAYTRAVTKAGNRAAQKVLFKVFEPCDAVWRGVGTIKKSGLKFRKEFSVFDAEKHFSIKIPPLRSRTGCICGDVLQGLKSPEDCRLFRKVCTPEKPVGACMVSSEGACAAFYKYGE